MSTLASPSRGSATAPPATAHPPPADQASRLRAIIEAFDARRAGSADAGADGTAVPPVRPFASHRAAVVAIASGKGGVGKTNASVNLSIALAARGHRVTLLDADLGLANADVLCGLIPTRRLEQAVPCPERRGRSGITRLSDIAIDAPGGFRLVPGSVGVARMAELGPTERATLLGGLADLERDSDLLVIDTAAGVGAGVLSLLNTSDLGLVVATPEPTSIADAYALIKCVLLQDAAARRADRVQRGVAAAQAPALMLIVNQARHAREAAAIHARIALVCQRFLRFQLPMLGWIALDAHVAAAVRNKRPFLLDSPRCRASRTVRELAVALARALPAQTRPPSQPEPVRGLAGRLIRLFHRSSTP